MALEKRRFNELFRLIDKDRNGVIDLVELQEYVNAFSYPIIEIGEKDQKAYIDKLDPSLKEIKEYDPTDFKKIMTCDIELPQKKEQIQEWLQLFDHQKNGKIYMPHFQNARQYFGNSGIKISKFIELFGTQYYDGTYLDYTSWLEEHFKKE